MNRKILIVAVIIAALCSFVVGRWAASADGHYTGSCRHDFCKHHVVKPWLPEILKIHRCESRNWFLDSTFDGGMQFAPPTWNATGSRYAYAWQAPILEQEYRSVVWAHRIGWRWRSTAGWPNCG